MMEASAKGFCFAQQCPMMSIHDVNTLGVKLTLNNLPQDQRQNGNALNGHPLPEDYIKRQLWA